MKPPPQFKLIEQLVVSMEANFGKLEFKPGLSKIDGGLKSER